MKIRLMLKILILAIIIININAVLNIKNVVLSIKGNSQTYEQVDHIFVRLMNSSWHMDGLDPTGDNTLVSFTSWGQMYINGTKSIILGVNKCLWPWFTIRVSTINLKPAQTVCCLAIIAETFYPSIVYNFSEIRMYTIPLTKIPQLPLGIYSFVPSIGSNTSSEIWQYYGVTIIISSNEGYIIYDQYPYSWPPTSFSQTTTTLFMQPISVTLFPFTLFLSVLILVPYIMRRRKIIKK